VIATSLAVKGVRARPARWLLVGLSLSLGVGSVTAAFAARDGLTKSFDSLFVDANGDTDLVVRSVSAIDGVPGPPLPFGSEALADRVPQVVRAEPVLRINAPLVDASGQALGSPTAPRVAMLFDGRTTLDGVMLTSGRSANGPAEGVLDSDTAGANDVSVGDTIGISTADGMRQVTIVGLLQKRIDDDPLRSTVIGLDQSAILELAGAKGVDAIALQLADGVTAETGVALIGAQLPPELEVITALQVAEESAGSIGVFVERFSKLLLIFAALTVFVGAFLVANVFAITVNQRVRELAVLRALGASRSQVQRMVLVEAIVVGLIATAVGIGVGMLAAFGAIQMFNSGGYGLPPTKPVLRPMAVGLALLAGPVIAVIAALVPARRASLLPPIAAMRSDLTGSDGRPERRALSSGLVAAGAAVVFVGALAARPINSLVTTLLVAVGCITLFVSVIGVATHLVSPVGRLIGRPLIRRLGIVGQLARDNVVRQPRRTTATAATLAIGVTFVTVATVFAGSLRAGLEVSIEDAVAADFLAYGGYQGVPSSFTTRVRELDSVDVASGFHSADVEIDGETTRVSAVDPTSLSKILDLNVRQGALADLDDGEVFVAESTMKDRGLEVGDEIDLTWADGERDSVTIAGTFERSNYIGNWAVTQSFLDARTDGSSADYLVGIRSAPGTDRQQLDADLTKLTREFPTVTVQSRAAYVEERKAQVDQLLSIVTALLVLALVIAVIGIGVAMALAVMERRREIGLVRVIGMDRKQLRQMVRWEAAMVSLFGTVIGLGLGLPIGIALVLAQPSSFVGRLVIPWSRLGVVTLVTVGAGLLAAIIPAARAARMNPVETVKAG
jgi:putative ABC transport system permease protein